MRTPWIYLLFILLAVACRREDAVRPVEVTLRVTVSKSEDPPEDLLTDINLLVFNAEGQLEERRYVRARDPASRESFRLRLIGGSQLTLVACANLGRAVQATTLAQLAEERLYLAYPDAYSQGMPLCGMLTTELSPGQQSLTLPLTRMMARVGITLDRTLLDGDVSLKIQSVRVGDSPRSVSLLGPSYARNAQDVFDPGFGKSWGDADALNREARPGVSEELFLYLLENCPEDGAGIRSYIELKAEYASPRFRTQAGSYVTYRFYPGEALCRGKSYHFILRPEGTALPEPSWSVDYAE